MNNAKQIRTQSERSPVYLDNFDLFDFHSKSLSSRYRLVSNHCDIEINRSVKNLIEFIRQYEGKTLPFIVEKYKEKHLLKDENLNSIVSLLYDKKILSDKKPEIKEINYHRNRIKNLWFRFRLIDTEKHGKFFKKFSWLFSKPAVIIILSVFTLLDIIYWSLFRTPGWYDNLSYYSSFDYLFVFIIGFMMLFFHEMGHIAAAKRYNSKTGGIGLGIYYYMIVGWADVHETWNLRIPERMVVSIAGVYWSFIYMIPVFLFCFFLQSKSLSDLILGFHASLLFVFNPFLKMDGYWFFSDLLGITNLQQKVSLFLSEYFFSRIFNRDHSYSQKNVFANYPKNTQIAAGVYIFLVSLFMTFFIFLLFKRGIYLTLSFHEEIVTPFLSILDSSNSSEKFVIELNHLIRNIFILVIFIRLLWVYSKKLLLGLRTVLVSAGKKMAVPEA